MKVLFVCLGNICRSPIAQGIFEDLLEQSPAAKSAIEFVDSAGTAAYHIGKRADSRMRATAKQNGFNIDHLRGRQVAQDDFKSFDYIFAMDESNFSDLIHVCPDEYKDKVSLFLSHLKNTDLISVPDPYYGDEQGFNDVLNLINEGAKSILSYVMV